MLSSLRLAIWFQSSYSKSIVCVVVAFPEMTL